jgi:hypothetical protein
MRHEQHELFWHIGIWRRVIIAKGNPIDPLDGCQTLWIHFYKEFGFLGWNESKPCRVGNLTAANLV